MQSKPTRIAVEYAGRRVSRPWKTQATCSWRVDTGVGDSGAVVRSSSFIWRTNLRFERLDRKRAVCMSMLAKLAEAVITGDEVATPRLVAEALAAGIAPRDLLHEGLLKGMTEVGRRFSAGEFYIPEVLIAAEAMKAGATALKPHLVRAGVKADATAAIGTVRGDLHDIGKNLVATMLEGAGFEVLDLGVDVPAEKFVQACRAQRVDVVAMSALLTTTMPMMEHTTKELRAALNPTPVILVGGAPVTQEYADRIGADGYGRDAAIGAELARRLCRRSARR